MPTVQFKFEAIGTSWKIDIFDQISSESELTLLDKIKTRIEVFDKDYSRFRSDSLVTKMSEAPGEYTLPIDAQPLFDLYQELYSLTDGALTPLIGQTMVEAGYDARYSLKSQTLHHPPAWQEALDYDYPKLLIKSPVMIDIGAAGKGYIIDIVSDILRKSGVNSFCVDAGADIFYQSHDNEPIRVGLEDPRNAEQVIGIASITNQSICGSAGNRRAWGEFHHIIDPHTLSSPHDILATWVVADSALLADALATCLFLVSPEKLANNYKFEYVILLADYSVKKSNGFVGELFLT